MSVPAFVFSPAYEADIGPHVFPTFKYRRVKERIIETGLAAPDAFVEPRPRDRAILRLAHTEAYLTDLFTLRQTFATASSELPLTMEIARWFEIAAYGTATATELALARGAAMHVGGGFHHAFADHAEGFCYLNDVAIAARWAMGDDDGTPLVDAAGREVTKVSVVDLDVHQGNGTARIFEDDARVFTLSLHQENNYPLKQRSDLDIGLPDGIDDAAYLAELHRGPGGGGGGPPPGTRLLPGRRRPLPPGPTRRPGAHPGGAPRARPAGLLRLPQQRSVGCRNARRRLRTGSRGNGEDPPPDRGRNAAGVALNG